MNEPSIGVNIRGGACNARFPRYELRAFSICQGLVKKCQRMLGISGQNKAAF